MLQPQDTPLTMFISVVFLTKGLGGRMDSIPDKRHLGGRIFRSATT